MNDELPPLPEYEGYADGNEPLYTIDQIREYARAAIALSRAQAAQPAQKDDVESLKADLAWHKESLSRHAVKLASVWAEYNEYKAAQQAPAVSDAHARFKVWVADSALGYSLRRNPNDKTRYANLRTQHAYEGYCGALLSPPAAAPVSEQTVPTREQVEQAIWAAFNYGKDDYKGCVREIIRELFADATSNQSQGGNKP